MKKSVLFRIALVMLVLTMVTSCFVGGTFAKYVTSGQGGDSARVAKFGVEVEPNGDLFLKYYTKTDDTFTLADDTVVSSDKWNVVAPGTRHDMTKVHLTGKPEVAVRVSYVADITLANWKVNGTEYFPVYFTINNETYGTKDCGNTLTYRYNTVDELVAAMEAAISKYSKDYAANTDLATIYAMDDNALEISWEWPFSTSTDNDVKDTALGDAAANATEGNEITIKVDVTTTVTQID